MSDEISKEFQRRQRALEDVTSLEEWKSHQVLNDLESWLKLQLLVPRIDKTKYRLFIQVMNKIEELRKKYQ
jgi:hypothetical protein